jgi:signal transduction histidine kinase
VSDAASPNTDECGSEALERDQLINAVRAREQFLEGILGSLESFATVDGHWRITFVNEVAARLARISAADLLGTDIRDLAPAGLGDQSTPLLVRAMSERVTVEFDVADSGEQRLYRGKAFPLDNGGLAIYVRDVTEQVRAEQAQAEAEEALQKEHARLQAIIGTIPVGFLIMDADGQVVVENDVAKRIWRGSVSLDGASDLARLKAFWPESGERIGREDWPGMQAVRHGRKTETLELDIERLDGTRGTCLSSAAPIRDAQGATIGAVVAFQDISERKQTDAALRESVAEKAAQRERNRLARELHDSVTQALFAAAIKAEALTLDDSLSSGTTEAVEDLRRLTRGALAQMRTLLLELRAEPLEQIPIQQLLRHLVEAVESRTSASVRLTVRGDTALPRALHAPVYRIVQEALNNVARHAQAANAWVVLDVGLSVVRLVIGDDGRGFDPGAVYAGHLGLLSMRERAAEAGAELRVTASPDHGTEIVAEWIQMP